MPKRFYMEWRLVILKQDKQSKLALLAVISLLLIPRGLFALDFQQQLEKEVWGDESEAPSYEFSPMEKKKTTTKQKHAKTSKNTPKQAAFSSRQTATKKFDLEDYLCPLGSTKAEAPLVFPYRIQKNTQLFCMLLDDVFHNANQMVTARILENSPKSELPLKHKKIYGRVTGVSGKKVHLTFDSLDIENAQNISFKAVALDLNKKPGLLADEVDNKTGDKILKTMADVANGIVRAAVYSTDPFSAQTYNEMIGKQADESLESSFDLEKTIKLKNRRRFYLLVEEGYIEKYYKFN